MWLVPGCGSSYVAFRSNLFHTGDFFERSFLWRTWLDRVSILLRDCRGSDLDLRHFGRGLCVRGDSTRGKWKDQVKSRFSKSEIRHNIWFYKVNSRRTLKDLAFRRGLDERLKLSVNQADALRSRRGDSRQPP